MILKIEVSDGIIARASNGCKGEISRAKPTWWHTRGLSLGIPTAQPVKWCHRRRYSWSFWLDFFGMRLHPSFQKPWKFWRCHEVPIFWGRIFSSISNHEAKKGGKFIVLKAVAHLTSWLAGVLNHLTGGSKLSIFRPWIPNGLWTQYMRVSWEQQTSKK